MFGRLFAIVFAVLGAGSLSQFPEYVQQYSQRLGGHLDELRLFVEDFQRDAVAAGLTIDEALIAFQSSNDDFVAARGQSAGEIIDRFKRYREAHETLTTAGPFDRLPAFVATYDGRIAERTWEHYRPAMPLTMEGALYAGAGLLGGLGLGWLLVRGSGAAGRQVQKIACRKKAETE